MRSESPEAPANAQACGAAFRPDGQELIAILDGAMNKMMVRLNLTDGKIAHAFPIPGETVGHAQFITFGGHRAELSYVDNRYVMLDNTYLFDIENLRTVWRYHSRFGQSMFVSDSPDGHQWLVGNKGVRFGPQHLASLTVPSSMTKSKSQFIKLENQLLLYPKARVRVRVQLHGQYANATQTVMNALTQRLKEMQVTVDESCAVNADDLIG